MKRGTRTRRMLAAVICAAFVVAVSASSALAGEVTGSGARTNQNQGMSWCSFSGLNDDPLGEDPANGPGGTSQSFGQELRLGLVSPGDPVLSPGISCNPQRTLFGAQSNRTK